MIKVAIVGYGNLGRGVERALKLIHHTKCTHQWFPSVRLTHLVQRLVRHLSERFRDFFL
jgi:hypothetical protein